MTFSVTSVLNSIVAAATRTPHAVELTIDEDRYASRRRPQQNASSMIDLPPASARSGKSHQALEHDTLSRIRDALYRDQQA